MNGLNLRICSDKKCAPLKKEIRVEDLTPFLPSQFLSLELVQENEYLKSLSASSVEEQVKALKDIVSVFFFKNGTTIDHQLLALQALVNILFSLRAKSPLLQHLLKLLGTLPNHLKPDIQCVLVSHLKSRIDEPFLALQDRYNFSYSVLLCLESPQFMVSFEECKLELLLFIKIMLDKCINDYHCEETLLKKLDINNALHCCVQMTIVLSQKYQIGEQLQLLLLVKSVLLDSLFPLDTRAAAGFLMARLSIPVQQQQFYMMLFSEISGSANDLSLIFFCAGLLNALSSEELQEIVEAERKTLINLLYCRLIDAEERNSCDTEVVLSVARSMVLLSRELISLPSSVVGDLIDPLLGYFWNHVDHYMDAVRHLANSLIQNIHSIALRIPDVGIIDKIFCSLLKMPVEKVGVPLAISVLISHISVSAIIKKVPGLVDNIISASLSNPSSNQAVNTLKTLIRQDFIEKTSQAFWFERWIVPLLLANFSSPLEEILASVFSINPSIISQIITFYDEHQNIAVFLTCLKIARKLKILPKFHHPEKWFGLVDYTFLENCMYHYDDNIRISCFALIVDSSKTTEEFSSIELRLIKTFINYNFSNQDPAFRQKALSFSKKFLSRLRDSRNALLKRQLKTPRSELSNENITLVLLNYLILLHDIRSLCIDSLFPGASPGRRSFSLGLLSIFVDSGFWTNFDENYGSLVPVLFSCLLDSYEDNKAVAKKLLSCLPMNYLNFHDKEYVATYVKEALILSSSIRPPDSLSAAYYMDLLAAFDGVGDELVAICNSRYFCLIHTLTVLETNLKLAKKSLLKAALSGPLYGHLFVIRHLLQALSDIQLKKLGSCPHWKSLIGNIIKIAFSCNDLVAEVVYNSSPEGHIPFDFSESLFQEENEPLVTSQMVLLCSWRTVKEVSLLLGELSERAPISLSDEDPGLLNIEQILAIGEHLTELLSKTKHRGAFEQAYLGFYKLSSRLWKCSFVSLHALPEKWLNETLFCIANDENLSATRRSAGIPFIIQALVYSELANGSCVSLHKVMKHLLNLSKCGSLEGRVHSLNILRALYRGSSLGEVVGPYVAEGFTRAISGFNAINWSERNSSTLLFSALISRVFGVPRGKFETLNWRNKMTGRLFFQRYPNLYTELLSHLEESTKVDLYPALYPVLLLLGRLYPSSLEGTDSNLQLLKFLPSVMKCGESCILKTRLLASSAVSSLIPSDSSSHYISKFLYILKLEDSIENTNHGLLLMVLKLLPIIIGDLESDVFKKHLNEWLDRITTFLCSPRLSYVTKETCILILLHLFMKFFGGFDNLKIQSLLKYLEQEILEDSPLVNYHYGSDVYFLHGSLLLILMYFKQRHTSKIVELICFFLQSHSNEIFGNIIKFLHFILLKKHTSFIPNLNESLKISFDDRVTSCKLADEIIASKELHSVLSKKFVLNYMHLEDLSTLLQVLQFFPFLFSTASEVQIPFQSLYTICEDSPASVTCHAIRCINRRLSYPGMVDLPSNELILICSIVSENSVAGADFDCRKAAAELLSDNFSLLTLSSSPIASLNIWTSAVHLILDDEYEIRTIICSKLIGDVIPSKGLELLMIKFMEANNDLQTKITGLLFWAVDENFIIEDDCIFDKGVGNSYYEVVILNRLASELLVNLKNSGEDILSSTLDDKFSEWLYLKSGIQGNSLVTFLMNYESSIITCEKSQKCIPCSTQTHTYFCLLKSLLMKNLNRIIST